MNNPDLKIVVRDTIATITLSRPEARNALTFEMYQGLKEVCLSPPEGVKAMIIRGAEEKAFAAGTDIRQFRHFSCAQDALDYERSIDEVLSAIEICPIPTIAAISGACTGGGAMIAGVCDLRICANNLKFGFPIARTLGNSLSAASIARLSALIGAGRVREIVFTSRLLDAEEAYRIGLVSEVLDDPETLFRKAESLALQLTTQAPLTLLATKTLQHRLLMQQLANDVEDEDMVLMCYQSNDFKHGLKAFLAKQKPEWKGN